ncbi:hypothetical protein V8E51_004091 [Hyaloscypha variabilis]
MADYSKEKVPDLKKLLQERGLAISGNKADLIARLQEDDSKKAGGGAAAAGEDEIDWDEDDKPAPEPSAPTTAPSTLPATTEAPTTTTTTAAQPSTESKAVEQSTTEPAAPAPAPEQPKPDFSIGLKQSDALTEAEKRAARAKRFGIPANEEAAKLAERAKKFGLETKDAVVEGLDSALPERKAKRGREGRERDGGEERASKRQTPDRRLEGKRGGRGRGEKRGGGAGGAGGAGGGAGGEGNAEREKERKGRIADDPVEKAKMEARAKKFGKPLAT